MSTVRRTRTYLLTKHDTVSTSVGRSWNSGLKPTASQAASHCPSPAVRARCWNAARAFSTFCRLAGRTSVWHATKAAVRSMPGSVRTHKSFQSVQATVSRSRDPRRMSTVGPPRPGWGILTPFLSDSRRAPHKASMSSSSSKCACWKTTRQIKACSSCKHGSSAGGRL